MPSAALSALLGALPEVEDLDLWRGEGGDSKAAYLRFSRAVGRAQVVLLSSHFERYFYGVNEEAITFLNEIGVGAAALSESLRLLHSREPLDQIGITSWERRGARLAEFVQTEGWLWSNGMAGGLVHGRLLGWMTSPKPENLVRYYRYWNIQDIFAAITRSPQSRARLRLGVQELVDKRNNIAHGDFQAQATRLDVRRYLAAVKTFCSRADGRLGAVLGRLGEDRGPW